MYGNIVLANTKSGFVPATIRFFTKSKFSHSLITAPDLIGIPMCIESASSGVDMLRFDTGYQNNSGVDYEVWEVNIPDSAKDAGLQAAINKLETKYGYLEIPWFIWRWLNGLFGKDIKNQDNWCQNGTICSQLCELNLEGGGLTGLFAGYGKGSVHPGDLRQIMTAHPEFFKLTFSNMSN